MRHYSKSFISINLFHPYRALGGWHYYYPHCTGEETEVLRRDVPYKVTKPGKGEPGLRAATWLLQLLDTM